ncbi:MAG: hypothetical protein E7359_00510 [Clostridiales bacterium]|nr:hypothetical protein [Clostridiales bacterium]
MEDKLNYNEKINKALIKRALGYSSKEVIEEFTQSDGDLILTKKKVTKKNIPPDMSAVKILLSFYSNNDLDFSNMTDEELILERDKLLNLLKDDENDRN